MRFVFTFFFPEYEQTFEKYHIVIMQHAFNILFPQQQQGIDFNVGPFKQQVAYYLRYKKSTPARF